MIWLKEIWLRRELLSRLVSRNLKIRYKGSTLGFFWSLLDPILMVLVYLFFIRLMRFQIDLSYLITGVVVWQFLVLCVSDSFHAVLGNANLVKKVFFPRIILPLSIGTANLVNFLLSLIVLLVFLLFLGPPFIIIKFVWLPFIVAVQYFFCLGLAFLFSSVTVFFRDTQHLVSVGLMAWFFASPIIYPLSMVPERYLNLYLLNPMCVLLMAYRFVFLGQTFIVQTGSVIAMGLCLMTFVLGVFAFVKLEPYFTEEL